MTDIILVEDHELVREGLKKVLNKHSDLRVVGEARDAVEFFEILDKHMPHLVILDLTLPGKNGLEVLKDVLARFPKIKVLVLSMHPEDKFAVRMLKAGASGYLTKDVAASELVIAIRKILNGGIYTSPGITKEIVEELKRNGPREPHQTLTDREFEVLLMIAAGRPMGQIADQMCLSINTVNTYRRRIMEKMKMQSNAELIRYAVENHLV